MKTTLALLALLALGCGPQQSIDWDALKDSVELSGDLRCEGAGELSLLGFLSVRAEGLAAVGGDVAGSGEYDGEACAGVRIILGPWAWAWVSAHQSSAACEDKAGTMTLELLDE